MTSASMALWIAHHEDAAQHHLRAYPAGAKFVIGKMDWHKGGTPADTGSAMQYGLRLYASGEVTALTVAASYRRRGVATALWRKAHRYDPRPVHSWRTTADGQAWALAVG